VWHQPAVVFQMADSAIAYNVYHQRKDGTEQSNMVACEDYICTQNTALTKPLFQEFSVTFVNIGKQKDGLSSKKVPNNISCRNYVPYDRKYQ